MIETAVGENFLTRILTGRTPAHAYLFFGPPSSGKEEAAKRFGMALLCQKKGTEPCLACVSCKKIESGNHPDFRSIAPEGDSLKIGQIRVIKDDLRFPPLEGRWKVFVVTKTDLLTEEAAQSMLKLLEEPPVQAVFILVAPHPSSVLPTIASRCQWVPFIQETVLSRQNKLMRDGFPDDPARVLAQLEFSIEKSEEWKTLIEEMSNPLFSPISNPMEMFDAVSVLEDRKDNAEMLTHFLYAFYRDVAAAKSGWTEGLIFPKLSDRARQLAEKLSWWEISERSRLIMEAQNHLEHSGNFRLVFENLLWKLRA